MKIQLVAAVCLSGIFGVATAGTTSSTTSQQKPQSKATKPIIIAANQNTLELNLTSNPTTGYSWYLKHFSHRYFKLSSYHYEAPNNHLVGAPGKAVFTFKVKPAFHKASIRTEMNFTYMRPWEANNGASKRLTILSIPATTTNQSKASKIKMSPPPKEMLKPSLSSKQIDQGLNSVAKNTERKAKQQNWLSAPHAGTPPQATTSNQPAKPAATVQKAAPVQPAKPAAKKDPNNWLSVTVS